MKYILMLILSFNSYATIDVEIKRKSDNIVTNKGNFKTMSEANQWIIKQENRFAKCRAWGLYCKKADYIITKTDLKPIEDAAELEKQNKKTELDNAIGLIDASNKPLWEKKLLKRLVKKVRD